MDITTPNRERMRRKPYKWIGVGILIAVLFLVSCKKGIPDEVIKPTEMENLLYDYQIARAMSDNLPYTDNYQKSLYLDYVFEKHHTTRADFDSSMVWYTRNSDVLLKVYKNVSKRLKQRQGELNHLIALRDKKPKETQPGDSIDIWYADRMQRLSQAELFRKLDFVIPADTNFKKHDRFVWRMRYTFLADGKNTGGKAIQGMSIRFENDSVASIWKSVNRSGLDSLCLKADSSYTIKEISGFVYYTDTVHHFPNQLLLDHISLVRYHAKESKSMKPENAYNADTVFIAPAKLDTLKTNKDTVTTAGEEAEPVRKSPREMSRPRPRRK